MALSRARVYVAPIVSFPAIMVLVWNYLMAIQYHFTRYLFSEGPLHQLQYVHLVSYIFFSLLGLLTDVYIGRYRAIMIGVILCFISWIILGITIILNNYNKLLKALWIVLALLQYIGFVSFLANIIQYNIDQLIGASANELSTIIYWNIAAYPTATALSDWLSSLDTVTEELLFIMASGIALSLILVSHSFFKHKLENISLIKNPIKLIFRVLCYARKHKYPENRSALTYWEEEAPSRLELGKDKYGGPFTEEEVEDVKTFFCILPLFIATFGYALAEDSFFEKSSEYYKVLKSFGAYHITVLLLFLIYLFIIRGCFHKYIPSMLSRMGAGLFFSLSTCILHLLIEKFQSYHNLLIIFEQVIFGISFFLLFPTAFEFTVAQSPEHMRGLMVGLCYSSTGFGSGISKILLASIKKWYYYIITCFFQLLILIIFLILAKRYKYRVRENEINILQIVDDHYQKYIEQENEHWQQRKSSQGY